MRARACFLLFAVAGLAGIAVACGDPSAAREDPAAGPVDAGPPPPDASGGDGTAPPARVFPRAATSGGRVIASPKLVVVTFAGDALEPSITKFTDALRTSSYFATVGKEYGVGGIVAVEHVRLPEVAPAAITDTAFRAWLADAPLGAPDADTLYAIFYPENTIVAYAGTTSCNGFDGYHGEIERAGTKVGFALLPRCGSSDPDATTLDRLTSVASHEIFEWATDPFPQSDQAWHKVAPNTMAWGLAFATELADLCDGRTSHTKPADLGFTVQSMWSNEASLAGHTPCQPAVMPVFVAAIPTLDAQLTLSPALMAATSMPPTGPVPGVRVARGASVVVPVHVYADAEATGQWRITATEGSQLPPAGLTFAFDRDTAAAGDDVTLTITAPEDLAVPTTVVLYVTRAGSASSPYTRWPFMVGLR
jgi:hypothetical protein